MARKTEQLMTNENAVFFSPEGRARQKPTNEMDVAIFTVSSSALNYLEFQC